MHAAPATPMAPAKPFADKKRRKGRRATQSGDEQLDYRLLHGAECSSVHVEEREEEPLALRDAMADMRSPVQGRAESDSAYDAFHCAGSASESVGEGGIALSLPAILDGAVDAVKESGASEKSSRVCGELGGEMR